MTGFGFDDDASLVAAHHHLQGGACGILALFEFAEVLLKLCCAGGEFVSSLLDSVDGVLGLCRCGDEAVGGLFLLGQETEFVGSGEAGGGGAGAVELTIFDDNPCGHGHSGSAEAEGGIWQELDEGTDVWHKWGIGPVRGRK